MKQIRIAGSGYAAENVAVTIPAGSQLLHVRICPGEYTEPDPVLTRLGTWFQINNSAPIMIRCLTILCSDAFGFCCEIDAQLDTYQKECNRYPGDTQFQIVIGQNAAPEEYRQNPDGDYRAGAPPEDWLIIYQGGP